LKSENYDSMSLKELRKEAKKKEIKYYYRLKKSELIKILKKEAMKNLDKKDIKKIIDSNPPMSEIRKIAASLEIKITRKMKKIEMIRLIKEKIKSEEKTTQNSKTVSSQNSIKIEKEIQKIEHEKQESVPKIPELPETYNKDKLVCLPVNPHWIHIYWDFSDETIQKLKNFKKVKLRIHDVTYIIFDGKNAHKTFEVEINPLEVKKYYFNVPNARANYIAEIGYENGTKFVPILRSNLVETPPNSPGSSKEEIWIDLKSLRKEKQRTKGMLVEPLKKEKKIESSVSPEHYTNN
jgi:hypothetical protein